MIQKAIVDSVTDEHITLIIKRQCACNKKDECTIKCFSLADENINVKLRNIYRYKKGDIVEVEAKTSSILLYAAVVFIMPLVFGLLSYYITSLFTQNIIIPYAVSGSAFILSVLFLYFGLNRVVSKKENFKIKQTHL